MAQAPVPSPPTGQQVERRSEHQERQGERQGVRKERPRFVAYQSDLPSMNKQSL